MLRLSGVWFRYPGSDSYALRGLSMEARRGELLVLAGPNGSGKTTALLVAAGLLEPERGEVLLDGRPLREQLPRARRRIGLLFQNPDYMLFNPTVYDEIAFVPRQLYGEAEVSKMVEAAARRVGLPPELLKRPVHALSHGEKKLVALASVISYGPELLLLDEPLAGLSRSRREAVLGLIGGEVAAGRAVVVATHEPEHFEGLGPGRVLFLRRGAAEGERPLGAAAPSPGQKEFD